MLQKTEKFSLYYFKDDTNSVYSINDMSLAMMPVGLNLINIEKPTEKAYRLELNFLSNKPIPETNQLIERTMEFFLSNGYSALFSEEPIIISISNLRLIDIEMILKNESFQEINADIKAFNQSVWQLSIQD